MPNLSPIFNPDPRLYPDPSGRAQRVEDFLSLLTLWEDEFDGENFRVNPFQSAIIRRIYGPCDEDGERLTKIACIWVPRGNAKTTLAAGLGLVHFMGPEAGAGAQVIAAAADRENAGIAFNCAYQFVRKEEALLEKVRPIESRKIMTHRKTNGIFRAISTEAYSKHGLNVSFFLADEIHAWPASEARKLWKVVTDSMVKRRNPLTVVISTAGDGMGSLAWDMWDYSHRVARGEIDDPSFAPIIFAADPKSDWKSPEIWRKANPAIDAGFLYVKQLEDKVRRAAHFPTDAADFKRFHLNIWLEGSAEPWIDPDLYDEAEEQTPIQALVGEKCWTGIDLSSVEDLTAVVSVFPDELLSVEAESERGFDILPMFFLPQEGLAKKADADQAQYLKWAETPHPLCQLNPEFDLKLLTLTPGNKVDQNQVKKYCDLLYEFFDVQEEIIDRWNSTAFVTSREDKGREIIEFGQGFASMAGPVKQIKASILGRKFRHGGNPILKMCFRNVVTEKDSAENEKFTKSKARGRIDGATASAQAIGRILEHEAEELGNRYRGFFSKPESIKKVYGQKEDDDLSAGALAPDQEDDGKSWSPDILKNINHPMFEEHKRRYEKHLAKLERVGSRGMGAW